MNEDIYIELKDNIQKGLFIHKHIRYGKPYIKGKIKNEQKINFFPSRNFLSHEILIFKLRMKIGNLFAYYVYKTPYGYFIPIKHKNYFFLKIEEIKKNLQEIKENILNKYDSEIIPELKRRLVEVAYWSWVNELGNEGEPPTSFVEELCHKRISEKFDKYRMSDYIGINISFINPIIDYSFSGYGDKQEIDKLNYLVVENLYNSIILRRIKLLDNLLSFQNRIKYTQTYKALIVYTDTFKKTMFYKDDELSESLERLKEHVVLKPFREFYGTNERIQNIIDCLLDNKRYRLDWSRVRYLENIYHF